MREWGVEVEVEVFDVLVGGIFGGVEDSIFLVVVGGVVVVVVLQSHCRLCRWRRCSDV